MKEKTLELERMVFFCDAIVAIAITLLVFGLKIDVTPGEHITLLIWERLGLSFLRSFSPFLLSRYSGKSIIDSFSTLKRWIRR